MEQQPTFHETYSGLVAGLPPSQLREAHKRLSKCKQPLTDEEIVSQHPRVQACLEKISAAYSRKKTRSAVSSKARRDAVRTTAGADSQVDAQEAPEPVVELLEACDLEPVPVECAHQTDVIAVAEPAEAAEPLPAVRVAPTTPVSAVTKPLQYKKAPLADSGSAGSAGSATVGKGKAVVTSSQQLSKGRQFFTNQR